MVFLRKLFWLIMFPRQAFWGALYGIEEWVASWYQMKPLYWQKPIKIHEKNEEG